MWFRSWFDGLRICAPRVPIRKERPGGRRAVTHRPVLETLEDRCVPTLNAAVNYSVASYPLDVVSRDFDGDGNLDVATVNGSQLSVLHGNGDGTFGAAQTTTVRSGLRSVAAGDFNSDGLPDLAITSSFTTWNGTAYVTDAFVNLLLNNGADASGNATFQALRSFSTGTNINPGALVVGDLNGDGNDDVAAVQTGGSNVTVLQGNGSGSLGTARHYGVGSGPVSLAVGDLDGGGRLDLITANQWSNDVSVLLNSGNDTGGNATFQTARNTATYGTPEAVAVGDFNPDGLLDLAVSTSAQTFIGYGYWGNYYQTDGYVNVLLGHGDGSFGAPQNSWVNAGNLGDLAVADFNADGNDDVVVADGAMQQRIDPSVLLSRNDGTFDEPYRYNGGTGPIALAVGSFNGDAAPDIAVANFFSWDVSVFINDADWPALGAPFVSVTGMSVLEGNEGTSTAEFTVSLTAAFGEDVTVSFATADGSALAGSDYVATSGTVTIPKGETSATVEVPVIGDRIFEWDESFTLNLGDPGNVRMGNAMGWTTILDDEPRISISGSSVSEGNDGTVEATFTVSLATAYDQDVTVSYATADGSAAVGSDYVAKSGTVTILAGDTSATFAVVVNGDRVGEQTQYDYYYDPYYYDPYYYYDYAYAYYYSYVDYSEYFHVNLVSSSVGAIQNGQGTGYIQDDEPRFNITHAYSSAGQDLAYQTEGNSGTKVFTFAVTMSRSYDVPVSVNFATANGSATAGSDYQARNGTLTFDLDGPLTQYIDVVVNGDQVGEFDEYFSVSITNPTYGAVDAGQSDAQILEDEPQIYIYDVYQYEGNSGTTTFRFLVTLSQAYEKDVTVTFQTVAGTASASSDFQAQTGTLTFKAGVTEMYIDIVVYGDTSYESGESFTVQLTGSSSYAHLNNNVATGYIYNDDSSTGRKGRKNR